MRLITKATLSSSALLVLTMLHHIYGAVIYSTPWRAHVVFFAGPAIVGLIAAMIIHRRSPSSLAGLLSKWTFVLLSAVGAVISFGMYEGGYNHLLKNIFYFGGASPDTLQAMFPTPTYEMPNDFIFELSGVAQFFVGLWAAYDLVRFATRKSASVVSDPSKDLGHAVRNV